MVDQSTRCHNHVCFVALAAGGVATACITSAALCATTDSSACKNSPTNNKRYQRRLRGLNTNVCEQTFAWFRGYARTLNGTRPVWQNFLTLLYVKRHSAMIKAGEVGHLLLCKRERAAGSGGSYPCADLDEED